MKALYTSLACMLIATSTFAQMPINRQINYEIRPAEIYYNGQSDVSSDGEVVTRIGTTAPDGSWYDYYCFMFFCSSTPCTYVNNDPDVWLQWATGQPWDQEFDLRMEAYEDDDGVHCEYNAAEDDDYYWSYATWTEGLSTSISQNALRWSSAWYSNDNDNDGGWLFPNSAVWNLKLKTAWRYTHGETCDDPLDFGQLNFNASYNHFNSTSREILGSDGGGAPLVYNDNMDNASADVFYQFSISEPTSVTITTQSEYTSFDTYLRLYNANCTDVIALNDDVQQGVLQSEIQVDLEPGTYKIQVEGYNASEGTFQLQMFVGPSTLGVSEEKGIVSLNAYPNPAVDVLNLEVDSEMTGELDISIYNVLGKEVFREVMQAAQVVTIPVNHLTTGTYNIVVRNEDKISFSKLVKK